MEKEAFLKNISNKLIRPRVKELDRPVWDKNPWDHLYTGWSQEQFISQYIENLQALNIGYDYVGEEEFSATLQEVINKYKLKSILTWQDSRLDELGVKESLKNAGAEYKEWDPSNDDNEMRQFASICDAGITYADWGLSETGSVLLFNGGGKGRVVSLLPPLYITILRDSAIVPRLGNATSMLHEMAQQKTLPACVNFITGPSRSADIEMDLAIGVHGPGHVHVILLKDQPVAE